MTEKITTICCAVALLATTAATPAFSQAKNFAGPSISIGGSAVGTNTDVNITAEEPSASNFNFGKNISAVPFVDASYVFPANGNFMFGIGARYDFAKNKSGGFSDTAEFVNIQTGLDDEEQVFSNITVTSNMNISYKDHRSIYLMPMYLVNNSSAFFAKIGYHETKGTLKFSENIVGINEVGNVQFFDANTTISGSNNFKGYGLGLGFRTVLSNNLYLQIEAETVDYDKESIVAGETTISYKPKPLSASLSIGYKF